MLGLITGIRLMIVRIFYGKYSLVYNELYKKLKSRIDTDTEKLPFTKCIKNSPQYNVFELFKKDSSYKVNKTNRTISFGNIPSSLRVFISCVLKNFTCPPVLTDEILALAFEVKKGLTTNMSTLSFSGSSFIIVSI